MLLPISPTKKPSNILLPKKQKSSTFVTKYVSPPKSFRDVADLNHYLIRANIFTEVDPINEAAKKSHITSKFFENAKIKTKPFIYEDYEVSMEIEKEEEKDKFGDDISYLELMDGLNLDKAKSHKNESKTTKPAPKISDMILDISQGYENINELEHGLVHQKNLNRVIKVRNILKTRGYCANNTLPPLENIGDDILKTENDKFLKLKNVGIPSFMKTKFKSSTLKKIKSNF